MAWLRYVAMTVTCAAGPAATLAQGVRAAVDLLGKTPASSQ